MGLGPVQLIAIQFDDVNQLQGQVLDAIDELTPVGAVRILDALFVAKEDNGDLVALEIYDDDDELGLLIGPLMGFAVDDDQGGGDGDPLDSVDDVSPLGLSRADVEEIGDELAIGTGAMLLLVEHQWAEGLRDAVAEVGGRVVAQGFVTAEGLLMLGAELAATAQAIEAVEDAVALEAEATLRVMEAAAVIEIAEEVEAAVVARTILTLVEAGFIEEVAAERAAAAVVEAALIEQAAAARDSTD